MKIVCGRNENRLRTKLFSSADEIWMNWGRIRETMVFVGLSDGSVTLAKDGEMGKKMGRLQKSGVAWR
ncbi:MAG: hypothetical protein IKG96_10375 [Bacteroidaceae bacterium]|nr:hypothetical protein [Bacteroidaceae bacterium]